MFVIWGRNGGHQEQSENIDQQGNLVVFTLRCIKKDNQKTNSHLIFIFKLHRCRVLFDLFETSQIQNWLKDCMTFFSSSWCHVLAATCDCGTPWIFHLISGHNTILCHCCFLYWIKIV